MITETQFTEAYRDNKQKIFRLCSRILPELAEDLTQETFINAWVGFIYQFEGRA